MATQRSQRQNIKVIEPHADKAIESRAGKAVESHAGSTQAMPDNRVLLTLDDGRSFVIDAERLKPQADGTYQVEVTAADYR